MISIDKQQQHDEREDKKRIKSWHEMFAEKWSDRAPIKHVSFT